MTTETVIIRHLGKTDYSVCWQAMRQFTQDRTEETVDEIWLVEHPSVFTQGQNGKAEHILNAGSIPVIQVDRGGQITYHGPGQLVVYTLVDLKRKKLTIRDLVTRLEKSIIDLLAHYRIESCAKREAPGVYVQNQKIGSIGLRVRRGCSYHGLALNVKMDLEPFSRINPCGFSQLKMTQLSEWKRSVTLKDVSTELIKYLETHLDYNHSLIQTAETYGNET